MQWLSANGFMSRTADRGSAMRYRWYSGPSDHRYHFAVSQHLKYIHCEQSRFSEYDKSVYTGDCNERTSPSRNRVHL
jgi:hypothetical protein